MRVAIATFGCKLNQYETQLMIEQLQRNGYEVVGVDEEADFYIINSCAVTSKASKEARMLAKRLKRKGMVIYTGCDSYLEKKLEGDVILTGNSFKNSIVEVLKKQNANISEESKFYPLNSTITSFSEKSRAFVKIQEGCNNHCTYCIIPFLRGRERDKDESMVIEEIKRLSKSYPEIVITGTNIGSYKNLKGLIEKISKIDGEFRVRISSIEPMYVDFELIDMIKDSTKISKHLHIPLQSGSEKLLKLMGRRYKKDRFRQIVEYCHKKGIFVGTDVIVGFYGEGEAEFKETYSFIEELPLSFGHVFSYSKRPFTPAERISLTLPKGPVVRERNRILRELFSKKTLESIKSLKGKEVEVVVEPTIVKTEKGEFFKAVSSEYVKVLVKSFKKGLVKCRLVDASNGFGYGQWHG